MSDLSDSEVWDAEEASSSGSTSALITRDASAKATNGKPYRGFRALAVGILAVATLVCVIAFFAFGAGAHVHLTGATIGAGVGLVETQLHGSCGNLENHNYVALMRAQCPAWLHGRIPDAVAHELAKLPLHMQEEHKTKMSSCCESLRSSSPLVARELQDIPSAVNASQTEKIKDYGHQIFDRFSRNEAPDFDRTDGNPCADDEEVHVGLCYKKCSLLTNNTHNVRVSAWTCCAKKVCNPLTEMRWNMGLCSGYDVAGDSQGHKACPHPPGSCLANEEALLGMCYRKCSEMTNDEYPNRFSPIQCCKTRGLSCMLPANVDTDTSYKQGGGADDYDPSTPAKMHPPLKSLTEMSTKLGRSRR